MEQQKKTELGPVGTVWESWVESTKLQVDMTPHEIFATYFGVKENAIKYALSGPRSSFTISFFYGSSHVCEVSDEKIIVLMLDEDKKSSTFGELFLVNDSDYYPISDKESIVPSGTTLCRKSAQS